MKKTRMNNQRLRVEIKRLILSDVSYEGICDAYKNISPKRIKQEFSYLRNYDPAVIDHIKRQEEFSQKISQLSEPFKPLDEDNDISTTKNDSENFYAILNRVNDMETIESVARDLPEEAPAADTEMTVTDYVEPVETEKRYPTKEEYSTAKVQDVLTNYKDQLLQEYRDGTVITDLAPLYGVSTWSISNFIRNNMPADEFKNIKTNHVKIKPALSKLKEASVTKADIEQKPIQLAQTDKITKINLVSRKFVELVLIGNRHEMPVDEPLFMFVHTTKVNDFVFLERLALDSLRAKGIITHDGKVEKGVILYVTGLSQALTSALKVIVQYNIPCLLMHFDKETNLYNPQVFLGDCSTAFINTETAFGMIAHDSTNIYAYKTDEESIKASSIIYELRVRSNNIADSYITLTKPNILELFMQKQMEYLQQNRKFPVKIMAFEYKDPSFKQIKQTQVAACEI